LKEQQQWFIRTKRNILANGSKIKSMERANILGQMENNTKVSINLEKGKDME
jgi:DNA-binding LytR/AlgR family response regulator